jgi:hypothetical protein
MEGQIFFEEVSMIRKASFFILVGVFAVMVGLSAGPVAAQCSIALVSDDSELDDSTFQSALSGMGISYSVFNDNETVAGDIVYMDDPTFLASWNIIVWYQSGFGGSGRAISVAEHDAVAAWLATGGRLIVTGYDVIGSPDDPLMADLIRSSSYGDYTDGYYSDVMVDHPITNGTYGNFVGMNDIEAYGSDNDEAIADAGRGSVAVTMVNYTLSDNIAKILVTEDPGTGMIVVFWNGNFGIEDWIDPSGYPDTYNLMRNMMEYVCTGLPLVAVDVPTVNWAGATLLVVLLAGVGFFLAVRRL